MFLRASQCVPFNSTNLCRSVISNRKESGEQIPGVFTGPYTDGKRKEMEPS
jgi:hypothetical protein